MLGLRFDVRRHRRRARPRLSVPGKQHNDAEQHAGRAYDKQDDAEEHERGFHSRHTEETPPKMARA